MAWIRQFTSFLLVGGFATLIQYAVMIVMVQFMDVPPVPSSMVGYLLSASVNYLLNYHLTFRSDRSHLGAAPRFVLIASAGFVLNGMVMQVATVQLDLHYLISQILATGIVLAWNFLANKFWAFSNAETKCE